MPKTIELSGVVGWDITAKKLKGRIDKKDQNIIVVDSVGGSVFEGNRLYNLLTDLISDGIDVKVILGAISASAASYFPLAVGAKNISVRDNTVFMAHKAWSFLAGNADELREEAEILEGFDKMIARVYSKINGKSIDENLLEMKDEMWLMGGQAVIDAGFASEFAEPAESNEESGGDSEPTEKNEIKAMIKEARNLLKQQDIEEDLDQWAAKMKAPIVNEQGQMEMFENGNAPQKAEVNKNLEADMKFDEYLDQNAEAKAELENRVNTAKAEAVKDDRERSAKIAKLYGNSDMAINAISNGTSVGDLAVAEKEKALEAATNAAEAGQNDLGGAVVKNQVPEKVENKKDKNAEAEKSVDAYLENGGK